MRGYKIEYVELGSNQWRDYYIEFRSLWAAVFKAKAIRDQYAANTRVISLHTGEVMVVFDRDDGVGTHINEGMPDDIIALALVPLN